MRQSSETVTCDRCGRQVEPEAMVRWWQVRMQGHDVRTLSDPARWFEELDFCSPACVARWFEDPGQGGL